MTIKIEQAESQFAQKLRNPLKHILEELRYHLPYQYEVQVSLLDANGRKKRSNASADNWSPESGRIEISFKPGEEEHNDAEFDFSGRSHQTSSSGAARPQNPPIFPQLGTNNAAGSEPITALLKALDRAESKPGWSFVPLRKFRDEILSSEHIPAFRTDVERQSVLRFAIEKRLILVGKVPNPRAPEFPVTTVRLNRLMPEVQRMIGRSQSADLDFHPVEIRGEPLSATILRERR